MGDICSHSTYSTVGCEWTIKAVASDANDQNNLVHYSRINRPKDLLRTEECHREYLIKSFVGANGSWSKAFSGSEAFS